MLRHGFSSLSTRLGAMALLAGVLVLGSTALVQRVTAQQIHHVVGPPIPVAAGYHLRQSLINTGNQPLVVRFLFLNAANFSPIASSSPMMLDAHTGNWYDVVMNGNVMVLPALEIQGQVNQIVNSRGIIEAHSTQMLDKSGRTIAFSTDGGLTTVGQ